MSEFNSEVVIPTLRQLVNILETYNVEYRFLGSVTLAAMNGKLHRKLGDLDLLVEAGKKDIIYTQLTRSGYAGYKRAGGAFKFARKYLSLEQLEHPQLLGIGFFYGRWQPDGSFVMGNKKFQCSIEAYALKKTRYSLYGIEFNGIPQRAIATGVTASEKNPKRRTELLFLKEKGIQPFPNTYIHIRIFNMHADWTYRISMGILNTLGVIRVGLGLAFDPWR